MLGLLMVIEKTRPQVWAVPALLCPSVGGCVAAQRPHSGVRRQVSWFLRSRIPVQAGSVPEQQALTSNAWRGLLLPIRLLSLGTCGEGLGYGGQRGWVYGKAAGPRGTTKGARRKLGSQRVQLGGERMALIVTCFSIFVQLVVSWPLGFSSVSQLDEVLLVLCNATYFFTQLHPITS